MEYEHWRHPRSFAEENCLKSVSNGSLRAGRESIAQWIELIRTILRAPKIGADFCARPKRSTNSFKAAVVCRGLLNQLPRH
jgi:hypothetical protein